MISATGLRGRTGAVTLLTTAACDDAIAKIGAGCGPGCRKRLLTTMAAVAGGRGDCKRALTRSVQKNPQDSRQLQPPGMLDTGAASDFDLGAPTVVNRRLRSERSPAPRRPDARDDPLDWRAGRGAGARNRHPHPHTRALTRAAAQLDLAALPAGQILHDRQSEPGSVPSRRCGLDTPARKNASPINGRSAAAMPTPVS